MNTRTDVGTDDEGRGAPPLWQQLQSAARVLATIRAGKSATAVLPSVAAPLRPGVQALVYTALRGLGCAEALRKQLAPRKPPAPVDALLCLALALAADSEKGDYEDFTLVNQCVEAAKKDAGTRAQANFVNACLRRFMRERASLMQKVRDDPVARWNHPKWWIERLQRDAPQRWESILHANNRPPPMTLRINVRKVSISQYLDELRQVGIKAKVSGPAALTLAQPHPVEQIPGFARGWVSVQDAAAQLAAPLLLGGWEGRPGLRVLDACAAPGGKTAHLLELADAEVMALDIDPQRCERITQTLDRLGLKGRVLATDAGDPTKWWDGRPFDAILLDAPCTASGIVRRHPDVRWLRRDSDVAQLAKTQARLLSTLWPMVKLGGRLLYCTCSVFRAEGDDQVRAFLAHNKDAALLPSPGHLWPYWQSEDDAVTDNQGIDHDGFYYALLEKGAG